MLDIGNNDDALIRPGFPDGVQALTDDRLRRLLAGSAQKNDSCRAVCGILTPLLDGLVGADGELRCQAFDAAREGGSQESILRDDTDGRHGDGRAGLPIPRRGGDAWIGGVASGRKILFPATDV